MNEVNEVVIFALGKILENQAAILCALMNSEKSEVMRAILERNVRDTESVMGVLKTILCGEPEKGKEENADAQDQAE